jgi:hypothetical protein
MIFTYEYKTLAFISQILRTCYGLAFYFFWVYLRPFLSVIFQFILERFNIYAWLVKKSGLPGIAVFNYYDFSLPVYIGGVSCVISGE